MPRRKKGDPGAEVTLPITAMLDLSFQLLSFFVISFKGIDTESQIPFSMPQEATDTTRSNVPLDPKDEFTLEIYSAQGAIALISLRQAPPPAVRGNYDGDREKMFASLRKELQKVKAEIKNPENMTFKLEAAADLQYGELVRVANICREEGFPKFGIGELSSKSGKE